MVTQSLSNPFADYGTIVHGDRFIGRKEAILKIEKRVLGMTYGNLAIVGLPRVGKSSLAWHAIIDRREELEKINTIPIFYEVGSCTDSESFFRGMVYMLYDELVIKCNDKKCLDILSNIEQALKVSYEKAAVQRFFKIIKRFGYKTIFIFDEFDSVQGFFSKADFQFLRELSYNPDTHLCLVTCSRKSIEDIEIKEGAISNFAGTFSDLRLGMFSDEDVKEYWAHFENVFAPTKKYKDNIKFLTGNHPWLMDMLNSGMVGQTLSDNLFEQLGSTKLELMQALDDIVSTLGKEKLLNSAIQLVVGPLYNVDQKQIEKLLKYDFIKKVSVEYKTKLFSGMTVGPSWDNTAYKCVSDYSTLDLYRRYYANVPYGALWSETENLLRLAVKDFLKEKFSDSWEEDMTCDLTNNPPFKTFPIEKWKRNLQSLKDNRKRMIESFPNMAQGDIVDFTLTAQIFDIFIRPYWPWFNIHIFKGERDYWNSKFEFITKLRNPVAHNNLPINLQEDMKVATEHCKDICTAIREWQRVRNED